MVRLAPQPLGTNTESTVKVDSPTTRHFLLKLALDQCHRINPKGVKAVLTWVLSTLSWAGSQSNEPSAITIWLAATEDNRCHARPLRGSIADENCAGAGD